MGRLIDALRDRAKDSNIAEGFDKAKNAKKIVEEAKELGVSGGITLTVVAGGYALAQEYGVDEEMINTVAPWALAAVGALVKLIVRNVGNRIKHRRKKRADVGKVELEEF